MAKKKNSKWVRGVNITVSPQAHQALRKEALIKKMTLRALVDSKVLK